MKREEATETFNILLSTMAHNSNCDKCQQRYQQFQCWLAQQKVAESTTPDIVGDVAVQEACLACAGSLPSSRSSLRIWFSFQ